MSTPVAVYQSIRIGGTRISFRKKLDPKSARDLKKVMRLIKEALRDAR